MELAVALDAAMADALENGLAWEVGPYEDPDFAEWLDEGGEG